MSQPAQLPDRVRLVLVAGAAALILLVPAVASADTSGSVPVSVTQTTAACFTEEQGAGFSFGSLPFSISTHLITKQTSNNAIFDDCANAAQTVLAQIGNLSDGAKPTPVLWTPLAAATDLSGVCAGTTTDVYGFAIDDNAATPNHTRIDDSGATAVSALAAGGLTKLYGSLTMPCTGSDGAGEAFQGTVSVTVTLP